MTRQKKEIIKKIDEIHEWIAVDEEMGCGFAPPDFYNPLYEEIHKLEAELARLSHYNSVDEMYHDDRWLGGQSFEEFELSLPR